MHLVIKPHNDLLGSMLNELDVAEMKLPVVVRAEDQHIARDVETAVGETIEVVRFNVHSTVAHPDGVVADLASAAARQLRQPHEV